MSKIHKGMFAGAEFGGLATMQFGPVLSPSAGVLTLGDDNYFHIGGTVQNITSIVNITGAGPIFVVMDVAHTWVHGAGIIETNTGADITTAVGDRFRLDQDSDGTTWLLTQESDPSLSNLTATGNNKIASAWVNFNGTGTVAIRDKYNVSSITDNGVGDYTINFTTAMTNSTYILSGTASSNIAGEYYVITGYGETSAVEISKTTTNVRFGVGYAQTLIGDLALSDASMIDILILGGL